RSSSPVIRRWTPDFDFNPRASFISSKEGEMPVSASRSWMNCSNSRCFLVSIASPFVRSDSPSSRLGGPSGVAQFGRRGGTKQKLCPRSSLVRVEKSSESRFADKTCQETLVQTDHLDGRPGLSCRCMGLANHQAAGARERREHRA